MTIAYNETAFATDKLLEMLAKERSAALSLREWKHRLAGYGYDVRNTENGAILVSLPRQIEICALPAELTV